MILEGKKILLISLTLSEMQELDKAKKVPVRLKQDKLVIAEIQAKAINIKVTKMRKIDESLHDWFTYWLIVNKVNLEAMGLIGFKGINFLGEVEIGYGITPCFRDNGYATEAVGLLTDWGLEQKKCKKITAKVILKDNYASQKVLSKNNFVKISENSREINYELKKKSIINFWR